MLDLKMKRIQVTLKNPENGKLLRLTAVSIKLHTIFIFIILFLFLISWAKYFRHFSEVNIDIIS